MKNLFKVFGFIILLPCLSTCKKDEVVPSGTGEVIIAKGVNVIKSQVWNKQIISVDSSNYTIRFSTDINSVQQIKIGDIIISDLGEGLLRKVKNITTINNELVVETEFASLSEAIQQGTINVSLSLTDAQIKGIDYHVDGVKLNNALAKSSDKGGFNFNINSVIYDFDGNQSTTLDQVKLEGAFSCDLQIPLIIDYGLLTGLKEVKFGIVANENIDLRLVTGLEYGFEKEANLATVYFTPITIMVGIVPVIFTPELNVIAGVGGSANASVTSEISQNLTFDAGIKYLKADGWSQYSTFSKDFGYQPPQLNMNANAQVYIKPELLLKVYGIAGPYANLKVYGRLDADILKNPWWTLYGGINMAAGVNVSILDLFTLDYVVSDLINYEKVLAQATGSLVSLCSLTTSEIGLITQASASGGGNINSDGGESVSARGVCWSTFQNPTLSDDYTSDGTGTGTFTSSLTGLSASTTYYLRAYATNSAGTSYGDQITFTTESSGGQTGTVTDFEGNVYNTVIIGTQTWMQENLRTTKYLNGETIETTTTNIVIQNAPKYQWAYNGNESSVLIYGRLYTWYAATDSRNVCPTGWRVPSYDDWTTLTNYLGGENIAGGKLKEAGYIHWQSTNVGATNDAAFTGLPGGYRFSDGLFFNIGSEGNWWSSSEYSSGIAWTLNMSFNDPYASRVNNDKHFGFSIRCLKNN